MWHQKRGGREETRIVDSGYGRQSLRRLNINRKKTVYQRFNGDGNLNENSDINPYGEHLKKSE